MSGLANTVRHSTGHTQGHYTERGQQAIADMMDTEYTHAHYKRLVEVYSTTLDSSEELCCAASSGPLFEYFLLDI